MIEKVESIGNVIIFPKKRIKYPKRVGNPFEFKELQEKILLSSTDKVNESVEHLLSYINDYLVKNYYDMSGCVKEQVLFCASLICFLRSCKGLPHVLQAYASEIIELDAKGIPSIKKREI